MFDAGDNFRLRVAVGKKQSDFAELFVLEIEKVPIKYLAANFGVTAGSVTKNNFKLEISGGCIGGWIYLKFKQNIMFEEVQGSIRFNLS